TARYRRRMAGHGGFLGRAGLPGAADMCASISSPPYVFLGVSGQGGRLRSRALAALLFAGWRSSSPLRSGGAGTTDSRAGGGRTMSPPSPAAACGRDRQGRGRGSPWLPCPVRAGGVGVAGLVREDSRAWWSPWWRGRAACLVSEPDELSGAGIAAGFTVGGGG